jgi:two-component system phosphate regulon sensor histidine kinase PhoR
VKAIARARRISINLKNDNPPFKVYGDTSGLSQVFINLINNAVKFSPEGEIVEVEVVKNIATQEAEISITDHGLGIPPESIPHLFERFFRANNVTVAEIPGTGIGLYIVKSIVDELDGKIDVTSELNRGTTFIIRLRLFH